MVAKTMPIHIEVQGGHAELEVHLGREWTAEEGGLSNMLVPRALKIKKQHLKLGLETSQQSRQRSNRVKPLTSRGCHSNFQTFFKGSPT